MSDAFEADLVRETIARMLDDEPEDPVRAFDEMGLLELISAEGEDSADDARRGAMSVHSQLGRTLAAVPYLQCAAARVFLLALNLPVRSGWCSLLLNSESFSWSLNEDNAVLAFADYTDEVLVLREGALFAVPQAALTTQSLGVVDPTFPLSSVEVGTDGDNLGNPDPKQITDALRCAESFARAALCAEMLGSAERCLDLSLEHLRVREQFGRAIGTMQAVQHKAADMAIRMEGMRSFVAALGTSADHRTAAMAKAYVSDGALLIAETCMQLHGGMGFTWECAVHEHLRHARRCGQLLGSPRTLRREHIGGL